MAQRYAKFTMENAAYSGLLLKEITEITGDKIHVRGFASMNTKDRDGDVIDPSLFDVDTFMKNPQLWINHALWRTKEGNGISVGTVIEMAPVKALVDETKKSMTLVDCKNIDNIIRPNIDITGFNVKDGVKGLWVVVEVTVPEVVQLVKDKRLNAFSWQGSMYRKPDGKLAAVDIMEVSLVNLPANQDSLFQIGKSLNVQTSDGINLVIDAEAVNALYERSINTDSNKEKQKGGESIMQTENEGVEKLEATLKQIGDSVATMSANVKEVADRVAKLETEKAAASTEDEKAKAEAEAKAKEKEAAENKAKEDAEKAKTSAEADGTLLKTLSTIADSITDVGKDVKSLGERVEKLENKPLAKKGLDDDDAAEADAIKAAVEKAQKHYEGLTPEGRNAAKAKAVAALCVPVGVGN